MGTKQSELSYEERVLIYKYDTLGASFREIGRQLGRHHTTISRELKRGADSSYQLWERIRVARDLSRHRLSSRGAKSKFLDTDLVKYVSEKLKLKWTPEIIAGRYNKDNPTSSITAQSIYNYIYDFEPGWIKYLARKGKKRRSNSVRRARKNPKIPNKTSISKRPKYIEKRKQVGHWELDTMVSRKSKSALVIATERNTRATIIKKIDANNSKNFKEAILDRLTDFPDYLLRTLTFDNGSENAKHHEINLELNTKSYFCDPYCSWQKGTVENRIGKIRRFIPKGTDLNNVSDKFISQVEFILNNTPIKLLEFNTPMEALGGAINLRI